MQITFLGTGTSHGVPTIDCMLDEYAHCPHGICKRALDEPRLRRTRTSVWIQAAGASLLIDTSQDFREQVLARQVRRIDAVLYTHAHADHIYGLPDIRSHCRYQGGAIPIYGTQETLDTLHGAFRYIFEPPAFVGGGIPTVTPLRLETPQEILGLPVTPVPVEHGPLNGCQGYRVGDLAYLPDVKRIPPASLDLLRDLDLLIINCLRPHPHASHLSLPESLAYAETLRPKRCLFTHMTHDIDPDMEEAALPSYIRFAYDGLTVTV